MKNLFAAFLAVMIVGCQSHQGPPATASRADTLIQQMTLEEKISFLGGATDHFSTHAVRDWAFRN